MQLTELSIKNQNVFVQHYIDGKEEMSSFFDYSIHHKDMWRERLKDLSSGFSQERNWRRTYPLTITNSVQASCSLLLRS